MRKCARITKSSCWINIEVCDFPTYEGLPNLDIFLCEFESTVPEQQWLLYLDNDLKATPTRWWVVHKQSIVGWSL